MFLILETDDGLIFIDYSYWSYTNDVMKNKKELMEGKYILLWSQ
jgi:hypothetical protein